MKRSVVVFLAVAALGPAILLGAGCTRVALDDTSSPTQSTQDVAVGDAESADVQIAMGAGVLELDSEAATGTLLGCDFVYEPEKWKPSVTDERIGSTASIVVDQSGTRVLPFDSDVRNEWNLSLTREIPVDLAVALGAGEADLDLAGMRLSALAVECGAGDTSIDLSGDWSEDFDVDIAAGVGQVVLVVPESAGVRVRVEKGLGDLVVQGLESDGDYYVNDAYGTAPVTITITLECGVGSVEVRSE